jgi:hypothetical protein
METFAKQILTEPLGGGGRGMEYGHLIFSYIVVIMDFMVEEIGALKENYQTI